MPTGIYIRTKEEIERVRLMGKNSLKLEDRFDKEKVKEIRRKMSLAQKGNTKGKINSGNKFSDSIKLKMSNAQKKRYENKIHPRLGKKHSEESKGKMSESLKGRKSWNKGKKGIYSEETIKKIKERRAKQILPTKDTTIEVKIQNFLKQLGIDFFTHQYIKIEHGYQCDILIPSMNLVIECDGDYWHKYPIGNDLDHIRTKELLEKGFNVLRLWEFEIKAMELNDFSNRLKIKRRTK